MFNVYTFYIVVDNHKFKFYFTVDLFKQNVYYNFISNKI